ncbi:MAG: ABC transporter permease [Bacteroidetes bacterium]|jgi:ABC-2 type transport system permease protein|nr:ABC transporter permease [Bacteroidota bacterium]
MRANVRRIASLTLTETRLFLREPAAFFFGLAFPVLLLTLFGTLFGDVPLSSTSELTAFDFSLPALIGAFIGQAGIVSLPVFLATYREQGILKRYHASPVSLTTYLISHVVMHFGILLLMALVMAGVAAAFFGLHFPGNPASVLLIGLLSVAGLFSFGFALSGAVSSPQAGQAIGNFLFLSMFFLSGAAIPHALFPDWLQTASMSLPLTHVVQPLAGVWLGDPLSDHLLSIGILIALVPLGLLTARRYFRWKT